MPDSENRTPIIVPARDGVALQLEAALAEYQARCKEYRVLVETPYKDRPAGWATIEIEQQKHVAYMHAKEVFELVLASIGVRS